MDIRATRNFRIRDLYVVEQRLGWDSCDGRTPYDN